MDELEHDPDVVFGSEDEEHDLGPYDLSKAAETPSALVSWLDLTVRLRRFLASAARLLAHAG